VLDLAYIRDACELLRVAGEISTPPIKTSPYVGSIRVARTLKLLVLPAPLGPIRP